MIDPREYNKYMKKANKASQAPKLNAIYFNSRYIEYVIAAS